MSARSPWRGMRFLWNLEASQGGDPGRISAWPGQPMCSQLCSNKMGFFCWFLIACQPPAVALQHDRRVLKWLLSGFLKVLGMNLGGEVLWRLPKPFVRCVASAVLKLFRSSPAMQWTNRNLCRHTERVAELLIQVPPKACSYSVLPNPADS